MRAMGIPAPGAVSDVAVEPCRDPLRLWRVRFRDSAGAPWRKICGSRAEARAAAAELRRVGIVERQERAA